MVSLMVILFSTKCFLFVYMYIDLLKLKAYEVFENSDADLSFFFKEANLFLQHLVPALNITVISNQNDFKLVTHVCCNIT